MIKLLNVFHENCIEPLKHLSPFHFHIIIEKLYSQEVFDKKALIYII